MCLRKPSRHIACQNLVFRIIFGHGSSRELDIFIPGPRLDSLECRKTNRILSQRPAFVARKLWDKREAQFPAHTSSFKDLTRSLWPIRKRQRHDLVISGKFDLYKSLSASALRIIFCLGRRFIVDDSEYCRKCHSHTLSKITSGPLTPPIVLYRIRGLMEVMRGSTIASGAMAARSLCRVL